VSLYFPDTPEGRAVEACAAAISDGATPGQRAMARKLARIAMLAIVRLDGASDAASFLVGLSRDALEMRGRGRGRTGRG
jgi:hypothetical protein